MHFLAMTAFAVLSAVVFGVAARETTRDRVKYGAKIFLEFMAVGLVLAWVLYFIP